LKLLAPPGASAAQQLACHLDLYIGIENTAPSLALLCHCRGFLNSVVDSDLASYSVLPRIHRSSSEHCRHGCYGGARGAPTVTAGVEGARCNSHEDQGNHTEMHGQRTGMRIGKDFGSRVYSRMYYPQSACTKIERPTGHRFLDARLGYCIPAYPSVAVASFLP